MIAGKDFGKMTQHFYTKPIRDLTIFDMLAVSAVPHLIE
jgi:hypothetical protein